MKKGFDDRCECSLVHENVALEVIKQLPSIEQLNLLADLYKVFGDTTRIRILNSLYNHELCVCDIAYILEMTQSAISHQLRVLKQARLVKSRKEGKSVFYSLDDEHVKLIIEVGMTHISES